MADYNFTLKTGATWSKTFVISDGTNRVSLAGRSAKLQARANPHSPVLFEVTSAAGHIRIQQDTVEGSSTGVLKVTIPGPLTRQLKSAEANYDLVLYTAAASDGEPSERILEGAIAFDLGVTR